MTKIKTQAEYNSLVDAGVKPRAMTADFSGHTPGPWTYFVGNADGRGLIRIEASHDSPKAGHHIASMPRGLKSESNAALIVEAVNGRAALLAENARLREVLGQIADATAPNIKFSPPVAGLDYVGNIARAALSPVRS